AVHNDDEHIWSVPLDHISIHDLAATDLRLMKLDAPSSVKAGETLPLSARIENTGSETAADASLEWYVNGNPAASITLADMEPNAFATVTFDYPVPLNAPETLEITVKTVMANDAVADNNEASASIAVKFNNFPTVTDLTATPEGDRQINLAWSAPSLDALPAPETVTEDFENDDYTPMSISGAGEWTVFDGDGAKTYNIFHELYNPYQTQPIGFQLFNRETAQVPESYWEDAKAHSGNNFMMAPSAQSSANSNWLISPKLSGNQQTVSFWARSYMLAWPESFEVYYSTTDNSPESFTHKLEVGNYPANGEVPEEWTEFTVELPEGALYFAIHHNSFDTLALFVDDITYEAAPAIPTDLAIEGYHIFRNGAAITETPVAETAYNDSPLSGNEAEGTHTFTYNVA
ncbi:MAG: choice-of-anchor J domain-containing protein, partial [Muribaculaceae bacterium]|nr:choice-of-anchor J domain-containing protein [Muribaculaceae bacterium]